jgi:ferredoxin-nitrite reductase
VNAPGDDPGFSEEQKQYLQGLAQGLAAARAARGMPPAGVPAAAADGNDPARPEKMHFDAQNRFLAAGKKLAREEEAKRAKNPLDMWDEMLANAAKGEYPKGTDGFLYRFHGLFYVAPAQDSYMCRLRLPNGILTAQQMSALADIAERFAGPYCHVTTRANLQLREIKAPDAINVLTGIAEAGLTSRGAGADNIRNVTGSATAGIDAQELIDTRPLASAIHFTILNHREFYGLPRKFNIAFDGGGRIGTVEETNDIGFSAVRVREGREIAAGVYFRVALGGITGHGDLARDVGVACRPDECVNVAAAIVRVFIERGDRTDRNKARLKYLLESMGLEGFWDEVETHLGYKLLRLSDGACEPRPAIDRYAHIGWHAQKQAGLMYAGIALPVSKLTAAQMRGIVDIARRYGDGDIRLTVWQNLLLSGIAAGRQTDAEAAIAALGLSTSASSIRAGLIACTGNSGCRLALSDTKRHAMEIADFLDPHLAKANLVLDSPLNIHLTGCPNSCAQHFIADIGLLGTKIAISDDTEVEGYHLVIGGTSGNDAKLAREVLRDVRADALPQVVENLLRGYLAKRNAPETFAQFAQRSSVEDLRAIATTISTGARPAATESETCTS